MAEALLNHENNPEQAQYLTFLLNNEMYALAILNVKEILEYGSLTPVPMMPEFIQGVINLRGEVVPVINLAKRFRLKAKPADKRTCVIIVEVAYNDLRQDIGVMVDSVSEVLDISNKDIRPAPGFGANIRTDFIKGMVQLSQGSFVIVLDEDRVLSIQELAMINEMVDRQEATA
ncbi:chemotaxis protein CheW [Salinibius halmophilus]|uniref:chemotaxis protein CheW n=1 Tax=Salinibius halmophilus TaxID=1853216 RepID=UPI000E6625F5|nr:chemotaxis protein CheW [Salinibius halmophilus]